MRFDEDGDIREMLGQVVVKVERGEDTLTFHAADGRAFHFWHEQDCCEHVRIEDVCGDLDDLVGAPLLRAEQRSNQRDAEDGCGRETWTFYEFATIKGSVTVRWLGESNGYYSEDVDFRVVPA